MFCPECGTLAFPTPTGDINCDNYKCGYQGPANITVRGFRGNEIDLSRVISTTNAETRHYEVIPDSHQRRGVLTTGDYMCQKCNSVEAYSYLEPRLEMAEIQVTMLTCNGCGYGWREH